MQLESAKYLEDIRQAGRTVLGATVGRTLDDYLQDKLLRYAVERCFEIMGEALRRLDERDPATTASITDYKRIIGFRNILVHGYSSVNHERVWEILEKNLPKLIDEVEALLA